MKLNLEQLIAFFDDPGLGDNRHASAVIGIIGEDLNAAAFAHYLENSGLWEVLISKKSPTPGTKSGKRLDRWIETHRRDTGERYLYQTEIKNWAGAAIGGHKLPVNGTDDQVASVAARYWKQQLQSSFHTLKQPNGVTKVLQHMKPLGVHPKAKIEPLLIYWIPVWTGLSEKPEPFFKVSISGLGIPDTLVRDPFESLNIFSVSLYVRQLLKNGTMSLDIPLPNAERRAAVIAGITA